MRAPNTCRIERRIASTRIRGSTWWRGGGTSSSATKVCLIRRQSSYGRLPLRHAGSKSCGYGRQNGCVLDRCRRRVWRSGFDFLRRCRDGIGVAVPGSGGCVGRKGTEGSRRSRLSECVSYRCEAEQGGVRAPGQIEVHCRIASRTRRPLTPPICLSLATNESRGIAQSGGAT